MRKKLTVLGTAILSAALSAQQPAPLALTHATLIDALSNQPLHDATVIIRDARIEKISAGPAEIPAGATVLDLSGRWLLPGFIDAHVHIRSLAAARAALASGATTVRSLGVDHFEDVGLRELHRAGAADLPDVIAGGYHVRPQPAEGFFLDFPQHADLMSGVAGPEKVRRLVRAMIARGVDTVKIMATERAGLPETDPRKRIFTDDELAAAVDEARRANRSIAAHAHGDAGARAAVRAGVRTIEHGTYVSEQTLALMKERGTCFDPTIATVSDLIDPAGDYDNAVLSLRGRAMLPQVREATARAWKMGVKVIAGTDTGYGPESRRRMPDEILELVGIGMSPLDAIKAGTSIAADCLGIATRTGSLRAGLEADFIAIESDPLADPSALRDLVLVINNGKVALNRLDLR